MVDGVALEDVLLEDVIVEDVMDSSLGKGQID
jgi:hypothetical protein